MHHHDSPLEESSWAASQLIDDAIPGDSQVYKAMVGYTGATVYFALKWQNQGAD